MLMQPSILALAAGLLFITETGHAYEGDSDLATTFQGIQFPSGSPCAHT